MRGAGVRLALGPTVTADLEGAAVAQDGLSGEGRLAEQVPDYPGRELGLDQIEDPAALCARAVDEVPGIEWAQVIRPQKAAVRHGLGPGITAESQGTLIAQNGVPRHNRLQQQIADDPGRELFLNQVENLPALRPGSPHEVA